MAAPRSIRPLLAVALAGALAVTGAGAASADTPDGGVAWTVQTADNDNGTGRGNFSYDVDPGAVIHDTMIVVNTGTEPLPLSVYAADAFTTSSGEIDVFVDGTPSTGAGTWVTVDQPSIELAPSQQAEVGFTITVPADARPGDHAAGVVTSLAGTDASQTLSVDRRLGSRINLRVAGELLPAATLTAVTASYAPSWNPFGPGTLTVSYRMENSGNTRITGLETVTTGGPFGAASPAVQLGEVIPGSTIEVTRDIGVFSLGVVAGSVQVVPEGVGLGAGTVAPISVEYSAVAIPWALSVLLLILVTGVGATLLVLRRRTRRRAALAAG